MSEVDGVEALELRVADAAGRHAAHPRAHRARRRPPAPGVHARRLRGGAPAGPRSRLGGRARIVPARGAQPRPVGPRGHRRAGQRARRRPRRRRHRRGRPRPCPGADRRRLARARARGRRPRRARARIPLRWRPSGCAGRAPSAAPRSRSCSRAATRRPPAARPRRCCASCRPRCPGWRSPSGAAASPRTRPTCTGRPPRRCSRPTSWRATPTARCWPSRTPAPTACCCSAMSEDPAELQRFYAETVEPLVAYDEQYETDLVQTRRGVPRGRRQRRRHRAEAVHAPPHRPLPPRAGQGALRAGRRVHRRAREAVASG